MPAVLAQSALDTDRTASSPLGENLQKKLPALIPRKRRAVPQTAAPAPQALPLVPAPDIANLKFKKPGRKILSDHDLALFTKSPTYQLVLSFVFSLSDACADSKASTQRSDEQPAAVKAIEAILSAISVLVDECPPIDQGVSRFGNPAFRKFIDTVKAKLPDFHHSLNINNAEAVAEISTYLEHGFGSPERIDYGSGHELNFTIWLLCINRMSLLPETTFPALALLIFPQYIRLLRKIQSTYYLEPAGSHGVWGLDDYNFLPFLFGASQLLHHPYIRPLSIHSELVLEEEGDEYMYLDMVRYTMETKTVKGLKWTQPMLDDISSAKNWEKVEQGMRKMFVKEVLGKLPIMQHFLFGSIIPAVEGMGNEDISHEEHVQEPGPGHVHRDDQWGDCCGIKIPSSVAAAREAQKHGVAGALRRVPFD